MSNPIAPLLWLPFILVLILCLAISKRSKDVLSQRLRRDGSNNGQKQHDKHTKASESRSTKVSELQSAFPPERLSTYMNDAVLLKERATALQEASNCVPDDQNVFDEKYIHRLTPTGFSMTDIRALGDFPDYAKLSGVPLPIPYSTFNIDKALPRPYRPLRWPYHQTMSLTKLEPDWWLELESTYRDRISQRLSLYATHGSAVLAALPGSELACKELMELALQFLCSRYPHYFTLNPSSHPTVLHNRILSTTTDLRTTPPLLVLLHNIPEDFALMLRSPSTGLYTFRAGIICSSIGWNLGTKLSLPLSAIHAPVPDYATKMSLSMDRFFSRLPTDRPIQRGSWGLEPHPTLYLPPHSPELEEREKQDPDLRIEDVTFRVDWQTLRRLPLSGAVCFNFKALFTPVTEMRGESGLPGLLGRILREGKEGIMRYKGTRGVEHVVLPEVGRWEEEQIRNGLVGDEEVGTLREAPFYKGWREKWEGRQGFGPPYRAAR